MEQETQGHGFAAALASVIRGARISRNMTIDDVSRRTGLTPLVLALIESGETRVPFCDVERLGRVYGHTGAAGFLRGAWVREELSAALRNR